MLEIDIKNIKNMLLSRKIACHRTVIIGDNIIELRWSHKVGCYQLNINNKKTQKASSIRFDTLECLVCEFIKILLRNLEE